MKNLITLVIAAGLMTGCVVPVPMNNVAMYPTYPATNTPRTPQSSAIAYMPPPVVTKSAANNVQSVAYKGTAIPIPAAHTPVASIPRPNVAPVLSPTAIAQTPATTKKPAISAPQLVSGKAQNLEWLAKRLFQNQTNGDVKQLIKWNQKENFAALGIGQFIWYPAGKTGRYNETFPTYLNYVKANSVPLPKWIAQRPSRGGPWQDTVAFNKAKNDSQMSELSEFLRKTMNLQANFMALRLKQSMPTLTSKLPAAERQRVLNNYQAVISTPGGLYPLLDYAQFKGDGSNPAERYNGKGWGLLQVLQSMEKVPPGAAALAEFMRAADDTLVTRIANAPSEYREAKMLDDWLKRVNTYRPNQTAKR